MIPILNKELGRTESNREKGTVNDMAILREMAATS